MTTVLYGAPMPFEYLRTDRRIEEVRRQVQAEALKVSRQAQPTFRALVRRLVKREGT